MEAKQFWKFGFEFEHIFLLTRIISEQQWNSGQQNLI